MSDLSCILQNFPPIPFAFAYGSGVFAQAGYDVKETPMIDLVFAVENSEAWHEANIQCNPSHYSALRLFGSSCITHIQRSSLGAKIYYNPYVRLPASSSSPFSYKQRFKYGVIELKDLKKDLTDWETLYVAGRMHKPVKILTDELEIINVYGRTNLRSALCAASLFLPERFTERQLFETISSLSYKGDIRHAIGAENPQKVSNLVAKNIDRFRDLYKPFMTPFESHRMQWASSSSSEWIEQDVTIHARASAFARLPWAVFTRAAPLLSKLTETSQVCPSHSDLLMPPGEFAWRALTKWSEKRSSNSVQQNPNQNPAAIAAAAAIASIVHRSSMWQTAKGLLTGGIGKSVMYAASKLSKASGTVK